METAAGLFVKLPFLDGGAQLAAVAHGRFDLATGADQLGQLVGFDGEGMVGPRHRPIESEMFFDDGSPHGDGGQGDVNAPGVVRKPRGNAESPRKRLHGPKVHDMGRSGVDGGALQENDPLVADLPTGHVGVFDLLHRRQPRRDDERLALGGAVPDQGEVDEFERGDLEKIAHLVQFVDGPMIEGRGEKEDLLLVAVTPQLGQPGTGRLYLPDEREKILFIAGMTGGSPRIKLLGAIDLELDGIGPGGDGGVDVGLGQVERAVVVGSHLGNEESGIARTDGTSGKTDLADHAIPPVPKS